jgi:hypothetical protein
MSDSAEENLAVPETEKPVMYELFAYDTVGIGLVPGMVVPPDAVTADGKPHPYAGRRYMDGAPQQ